MSLAAQDEATACRNMAALRKVLQKLPRDVLGSFAEGWGIKMATQSGARAVEAVLSGCRQGVSHARFAQLDLKSAQLDTRRRWTALRAVYETDPPSVPVTMTAQSFRQRLGMALGALTRHHAWCELYEGNIWSRIAFLEGASPDTLRVASEVIYVVHITGTPFVLCTTAKTGTRTLLYPALAQTLGALRVEPQGLSTSNFASAEELLTKYRSVDPASATNLKRLNSNPFDTTARAAKRSRDEGSSDVEQLDKSLRAENERARDGVLGDETLPSLPTLSFMSTTRLEGDAGDFAFRVVFEGSSVLEGLRLLSTVPGALTHAALPEFLRSVPSEAHNAFAIAADGTLSC